MARDQDGHEVLDRDACLELLGGATFGRVGISWRAMPLVVPVECALVDEALLVLHVGASPSLRALDAGAVTAFQADDPRAGWTVCVVGTPSPVRATADLDAARRRGLPRWPHGAGARFVGLPTTYLTGRRVEARLSPG